MTGGILTCIDRTGRYFASVIAKTGRNEVQIFKVNPATRSSSESNLPVTKSALEADQRVTSVCWAYGKDGESTTSTPSSTPSKKRGSNGGAKNGSATEESILLVVALEGGDLLVYTPGVSEPIRKIASGTGSTAGAIITSISPSHKNNSVWVVYEDSANLVEYSLTTSAKPLKTFKFEEGRACSVAHTLLGGKVSNSSRSQPILVGGEASSSFYLVDPSKPKKSLLMKYDGEEDDEESGAVVLFQQDVANPDTFAVVRANSKDIQMYSTEKSLPIGKFTISSGSRAISALHFVDGALLAVTSDAVEVFDVSQYSHTSVIKTNVAQRPLRDIVALTLNTIVGVWYDQNEPRFVSIDWSETGREAREIVVRLEEGITSTGSGSNTGSGSLAQETGGDDIDMDSEDEEYDFLSLRKPTIKNISSEELFAELNNNPQDSILLCSQNNNEQTIKTTVKLLCESLPAVAKSLFDEISKQVAAKPTRTASLSIWLKWLLLTHGGYIASQPDQRDNLRSLQEKLSSGMKLMPKLLALEGRLNLLRSQQQLRERIVDDDEEDEEAVPVGGDDDDEEDNLVYANGENDDGVVIEAGDEDLEEEDDD